MGVRHFSRFEAVTKLVDEQYGKKEKDGMGR
jgi:hypothetical protein